MNQPAVEVADLLRAQGSRFLGQYQSSFGYQKLKVFRALQNCRTSAFGGHLDSCSKCGRQAISYNSCRNRHCPKCQAHARQHWLEAREQEVLPVEYFHVVFSVPHELNVFALENPVASTNCFLALAPQPLWNWLPTPSTWALILVSSASFIPGPESVVSPFSSPISSIPPFSSIPLPSLHPHIHCVIPAGDCDG